MPFYPYFQALSRYITRRNNFKLRYFIGDAPILCQARAKVGHTGYFGCPICQAPGQTCRLVAGRELVTDRKNSGQQRTTQEALGRVNMGPGTSKFDGGSRVYGFTSLNAKHWTHEELLEVRKTPGNTRKRAVSN